jgi:hypothetical protein
MTAVRGYSTLLLLCVLVTEIAVAAAKEPGSSAIRARGQGRTPNGKRRQVSRYIQGVLINATLAVFLLKASRQKFYSTGLSNMSDILQVMTDPNMSDILQVMTDPNMSDILQVMIDPNRAASFAHTALRRRPDEGIKSGLDKSILNETLGPTTVERDGRCEYQVKGVSNMGKQQAFYEV